MKTVNKKIEVLIDPQNIEATEIKETTILVYSPGEKGTYNDKARVVIVSCKVFGEQWNTILRFQTLEQATEVANSLAENMETFFTVNTYRDKER